MIYLLIKAKQQLVLAYPRLKGSSARIIFKFPPYTVKRISVDLSPYNS